MWQLIAPCLAVQPSQELRQYFSAAGPEVERNVMQLLDGCAKAVFPAELAPEPIAFLSSSMSVERRQEVCKSLL